MKRDIYKLLVRDTLEKVLVTKTDQIFLQIKFILSVLEKRRFLILPDAERIVTLLSITLISLYRYLLSSIPEGDQAMAAKMLRLLVICDRPFVLVGLGVSGSHDLAEIAAEIAGKQWCYSQQCYSQICDMRIGRLALSESHKWLHLTPVDGSSVNSFSFEANALFPTPHSLQLARQSSQPPGLCRLGVGSISQRWGTSYDPYGLAGPPIRLAGPALGQPNHHFISYIVPYRVSVLTDKNTNMCHTSEIRGHR